MTLKIPHAKNRANMIGHGVLGKVRERAKKGEGWEGGGKKWGLNLAIPTPAEIVKGFGKHVG